MKELDITFSTILHAFKHQWKCFFATVLIFSLLGAGAGCLYAGRGAASASGSAEPLQETDFSNLDYNKDYYNACYNSLSLAYQNAVSYLNTVSEEKTLTSEQSQQLMEYSMELQTYNKETLLPIKTTLGLTGKLYIPEEFLQDCVTEYESKLLDIEYSLILSEQAAEIVKSMDAPALDNEDITKTYSSLLSQANNYGYLLKNKTIYGEYLDLLQNHMDQVQADSRKIERMLNTALRKLNKATAEICATVDSIAQEKHLNISMQYDKNGAVTAAIAHTHRAATSQESFLAIFLFCVLTGICGGAFFAVCLEARYESRKNCA